MNQTHKLSKHYIKAIQDSPLLTCEEERELIKQIQNSKSPSEKDSATLSLVKANLRLVVQIASNLSKMDYSEYPLSDLVGEGNIGLIQAVQKTSTFKNELFGRFASFATPWITYKVLNALNEKSRIISCNRHTRTQLKNYKLKVSELQEKLNRKPFLEEVAKYMDVPFSRVAVWDRTLNSIASMDEILTQKDSQIFSYHDICQIDSATNPDNVLERQDAYEALFLVVKQLPKIEKTVLVHRYGLYGDAPKSLQEIGFILGLSGERVRQIIRQVVRKLRLNLKELENSVEDLHNFNLKII